jgi:hypothetical protein
MTTKIDRNRPLILVSRTLSVMESLGSAWPNIFVLTMVTVLTFISSYMLFTKQPSSGTEVTEHQGSPQPNMQEMHQRMRYQMPSIVGTMIGNHKTWGD